MVHENGCLEWHARTGSVVIIQDAIAVGIGNAGLCKYPGGGLPVCIYVCLRHIGLRIHRQHSRVGKALERGVADAAPGYYR